MNTKDDDSSNSLAHPADAGAVAVEQAKPDLATHWGRLTYIRDFGDERLTNAVRTGQMPIHAAIEQIQNSIASQPQATPLAATSERKPLTDARLAGLEQALDICQDVIREADNNSECAEEMGATRCHAAIETAIRGITGGGK